MNTGYCVSSEARPEQIVLDLIHDLSQPLSTIEAIASILESRLPEELTEARECVNYLQELVHDASGYLSGAARASSRFFATNESPFGPGAPPTPCGVLPALAGALVIAPSSPAAPDIP